MVCINYLYIFLNTSTQVSRRTKERKKSSIELKKDIVEPTKASLNLCNAINSQLKQTQTSKGNKIPPILSKKQELKILE